MSYSLKLFVLLFYVCLPTFVHILANWSPGHTDEYCWITLRLKKTYSYKRAYFSNGVYGKNVCIMSECGCSHFITLSIGPGPTSSDMKMHKSSME